MVKISSPWLAIVAWLPAVLAADKLYQFNVANTAVNADGYNRQAITVNGQFPGTLITANKGDRLLLNVSNTLNNPAMRRSTTVVSPHPSLAQRAFI